MRDTKAVQYTIVGSLEQRQVANPRGWTRTLGTGDPSKSRMGVSVHVMQLRLKRAKDVRDESPRSRKEASSAVGGDREV